MFLIHILLHLIYSSSTFSLLILLTYSRFVISQWQVSEKAPTELEENVFCHYFDFDFEKFELV